MGTLRDNFSKDESSVNSGLVMSRWLGSFLLPSNGIPERLTWTPLLPIIMGPRRRVGIPPSSKRCGPSLRVAITRPEELSCCWNRRLSSITKHGNYQSWILWGLHRRQTTLYSEKEQKEFLASWWSNGGGSDKLCLRKGTEDKIR
jgi:hypothetical protein